MFPFCSRFKEIAKKPPPTVNKKYGKSNTEIMIDKIKASLRRGKLTALFLNIFISLNCGLCFTVTTSGVGLFWKNQSKVSFRLFSKFTLKTVLLCKSTVLLSEKSSPDE